MPKKSTQKGQTSLKKEKKIILASANQDRKKAFEAARILFDVIPSNLDERSVAGTDPINRLELIAQKKASIVRDIWLAELQKREGSAIIIAAHTMILFRNELVGRAKDKQQAFEILSKLSGQSHQMVTAVAIMTSDTQKVLSHVDYTNIHFQELTPDEIHAYLDNSNEYIDRPGSYSISNRASLFIDKIEGSPTNLLGIPMAWLRKACLEFGINLLEYTVKK
jgi:septum formation protein